MNATADRARAEAERIVNANAAAANANVPPAVQAPPVALDAALPPALVVIDNSVLAQLLAACQPQPHAAGAILPEQAGSDRLKAFSSTDSVEWISWKTHYLEVCEINAWACWIYCSSDSSRGHQHQARSLTLQECSLATAQTHDHHHVNVSI
jgi:hypothetical protein